MLKKIAYILVLVFISFQIYHAYAIQRFPKPEFESGHTQPPVITPDPKAAFWDAVDVMVLIAGLSLISWMIIKKRSRKGVFWMSVFSIVYFGFFREGCVCSVGSLQNITLALFHPDYHIPVTVIAFFTLPIIYTAFFGRVFCAGICPLGAIQDIFVFKPMPVKSWLEKVLGLIPFIYLGLAVLYAATKTDFIICRYDPFVGIFRFNATFSMFLLGGLLLLAGVFIARPYCRFFCPYGIILNLVSRVSKYHLTITPAECIQCKLCENSCPFGAIDKPLPPRLTEDKTMAIRRFIIIAIVIPFLMVAGGFVGSQFHENLAKVNHTVQLARELSLQKTYENEKLPIEIEAFRTSGKALSEVYLEAAAIMSDFYTGGWILGAFIGLVFGLTLLSLSIYKYTGDYVPNKGTCLSCGRCMDYCPVKLKEI